MQPGNTLPMRRPENAPARSQDTKRGATSATLAPIQGTTAVSCPSPLVVAVLERGIRGWYYVYPENSPARRVERWQAPALRNEAEAAALEIRLTELDRLLAPAQRPELLARILALLSHYRLDSHPAHVEMRMADDWAEDLGDYPMWAVEEAARRWRRTRKFKPQICEMIELCAQAVGALPQERDRLKQVLARRRVTGQPLVGDVERLALATLRRLPVDAAD